MKHFLYFLLNFGLFFFFACSTKIKKEENTKKDTVRNSVIEQATSEPVRSVLGEFSFWKGALYPKNIQLSLWLSQKDGFLTGEVVYTKSGKPIKVAGKVDGDYFTVYEFDKSGNITGIFSLQVKGDSLSGTWYSPQNGKNYDFKSTKAQSVRNIDIDSLFTPKPAPLGRYRYSFGEEKGYGEFTCEDILQDLVHLQLDAVTPAPAFHIAALDDTVAFELGMKATVLPYSANDGACQFNITFFDTFASIDYVDNKMECDFGYNAHPVGIYCKVK